MLNSETKKIRVIDSPCGSGKTTWAISHILQMRKRNEHIIYITPSIKEVDRISNATGIMSITSANRYIGNSVGKSISMACSHGDSIAITHAAIALLPNDLSNYHIILDEAVDLFNPMAGSWDVKRLLIEHGLCEIIDDDSAVFGKKVVLTSYGRKMFKEIDANTSKLIDIVDLVNSGNVIYDTSVDVFYSYVSIEKLLTAKSLTIMTYQFNGSQLSSVLNPSQYDKYFIQNNELATWYIGCDAEFRENTLKNIIFTTRRRPTSWGKVKYTFGGQFEFEKKRRKYNENNMKHICYDIERWMTDNPMKSIFTCYSDTMEYGIKNHKNFPKESWVPYNCKGTNDYHKIKKVGYFIDRYQNTLVHNLLCKLNKIYNGTYDYNTATINDIIQFLYRSALRDGKKIKLYMPADRTRNLLIDWANAYINSENDIIDTTATVDAKSIENNIIPSDINISGDTLTPVVSLNYRNGGCLASFPVLLL